MKVTQKSLIVRYYAVYALLIVLLAVVHFAFPTDIVFAPQSTPAIVISTVNIVFLLCIPLILKLFSKKVPETAPLSVYTKWSILQIYLVAIPGLTSVVAYAFLRDMTSLFCYLIAFVALVFCKPTSNKWVYYESNDLSDEAVTLPKEEAPQEEAPQK